MFRKLFWCFGALMVSGEFLFAEPLVKVGIVTDTHVTKYPQSCQRVRAAFELFKKHRVDLVVNVGDLADVPHPQAYKNYRKAFDEVFSDFRPKEFYVYANHDRIGKPLERGYREFGEMIKAPNGPFAVLKLKGYTFLTVPQSSPQWRKGQNMVIQAVKDNPTKPVFLFEHIPSQNTVYDSKVWGQSRSHQFLNSFPSVIQITGHVHGSLRNELNIWQDKFTVVSAGCLQVWNGALVGTWAPSKRSDEAIVMEVYPDKILFRRFACLSGEELFPDNPWCVPWPFDPKTAPYNFSRRAKNYPVPQFAPDSKITLEPDYEPCNKINIAFNDAKDAFFHQVEFLRQKADGSWEIFTRRDIFSEFYLPENKRTGKLQLSFNAGFFESGKNYRVRITPYNFFDRPGLPLTKEFTMPQKLQWETVFEPADPMTACPMYTGKAKGRPLAQKNGYFINNVWYSRITFPDKVWAGARGTLFRVIIELRMEQDPSRQWTLRLVQPRSVRLYTPSGKSGLQRYVFTLLKPTDDFKTFISFCEGGEGKVRIEKIKVERME